LARDTTTLLKFSNLLEAKRIRRKILETINGHLAEEGFMMPEGMIAGATLIDAPRRRRTASVNWKCISENIGLTRFAFCKPSCH